MYTFVQFKIKVDFKLIPSPSQSLLIICNRLCIMCAHTVIFYFTEPFDLTNTARSVYDRGVFERVKEVFQISYNKLKKSRDIESIFRLNEKD